MLLAQTLALSLLGKVTVCQSLLKCSCHSGTMPGKLLSQISIPQWSVATGGGREALS